MTCGSQLDVDPQLGAHGAAMWGLARTAALEAGEAGKVRLRVVDVGHDAHQDNRNLQVSFRVWLGFGKVCLSLKVWLGFGKFRLSFRVWQRFRKVIRTVRSPSATHCFHWLKSGRSGSNFSFLKTEFRVPYPDLLFPRCPIFVRKVAVVTVLYPKMYLYQNLLRHPSNGSL
jgi:hypothetical protein